jgi:glycolate oxidase
MARMAELLDGLRHALGPGGVLDAGSDLSRYSRDWSGDHVGAPLAVLRPSTTEEVREIVRRCAGAGVPLVPQGGHTGLVDGATPSVDGRELVVSLERMNRIRRIDVLDFSMVAEAGCILADVKAAAAEADLFFPLTLGAQGSCQIGGNIATNAGGPRCLKYGVTRHYVLGLEAVLADGRVLRTGGRVHKNKTGFDLTALLVGSEGLLAVITEATLRLIPRPPARGMLAAVFPRFADAAACVQGVLNSGHLPSALEITDGFTLRAARAHLGPASLPEGEAHLLVETDGAPAAVAAELAALRGVLAAHGATAVDEAPDEEACEALWRLRREFSYALRATGLTKLNEDIVVPRSKLTELVRFAATIEAETGIPVACFGHAGDGNIHANLMVADASDPAVMEVAGAALDRLFNWVLDQGGAITGEHGVGLAKLRWIERALGPGSLAMHRAVKAAFDPLGILNPGKMLP